MPPKCLGILRQNCIELTPHCLLIEDIIKRIVKGIAKGKVEGIVPY
jgi:hypothetical protein